MLTKIKRLKRYCAEYWKIENYTQALNDPSIKWECHHRSEIQSNGTLIAKEYLIANNLYYHLNPEDLIFLTPSEHRELHNKYQSSETREKRRKSAKRAKSNVSIETKNKISESKKGKLTKRSTEFSKLFYSHFGILSSEDMALYMREKKYYKQHNHFSNED